MSIIESQYDIITVQRQQLKDLRTQNKKLMNQKNNANSKVSVYKASAMNWKKAHTDLTVEFNELNKIITTGTQKQVLECIKKYKENM